MDLKNIAFGDTWIEKQQYQCHRNPVLIDEISINKIIVPNKVSFGKTSFKYFIGCKDNKKVKPLCKMLQKVSEYRKRFNETKQMCFG